MDKIEKIKKYVQKQMELYWKKLPDADDENPTQIQLRDLGQYMAYENMEIFLDSLQEEEKSPMEILAEKCPQEEIDPQIARCVADHWWEMLDSKDPDKSLEEAALSYVKNKYNFSSELVYNNIGTDDFKAGAEWQKEQDEVEKNLKYLYGMDEGARIMKEQMMEEGIDCIVKEDAGGYPYIERTIELYDYEKDEPRAKKGDKYKLILIRDEDTTR